MSPEIIIPPDHRERPESQAFARFVAYTRQKRHLEQQLDAVKAALDALSYQLRDYLTATGGFEGVKIDGFTVYLRRQLWARKFEWASAQQVCDALKRNGMARFVKEQYNTQTLSKHIRELEKAHAGELKRGELGTIADLLPTELKRVLNIEPSFTVIALEGSRPEEED